VRLVGPTPGSKDAATVEVRVGSRPLAQDEASRSLDASMAADVVHAAASARWSWRDPGPEVTVAVRAALTSWAAPFGWDR
jgi:hypothetical protein